MNRLYSGSGVMFFGIMMVVFGWRDIVHLRIASIFFIAALGILMVRHGYELSDAECVESEQ